MPVPYLGEIRMFAATFAPSGWAFCQGQLMAINQNAALFNLIGTTYGGDGLSTFALPDLRGRIPLHQTKQGYPLGQAAGAEQITVTVPQIPAHTHQMMATSNPASVFPPAPNVTFANATAATITPYGSDNPQTTLSPQMIGSVGGNQPHENLQPCLCINFMIALSGKYPT